MWIKLTFLALSSLAAQPSWETHTQQGAALEKQGRYADAVSEFTAALRTVDPARPVELASALQNLAAIHLVLARPAQAEPLLRRAYDLRLQALGPRDPRVGVTLHALAEVAQSRGNYLKAEGLYQQAFTVLESAFGPSSLSVADLQHNRATLYRETGRDPEARPLLEQAAAIYRTAAPLHPKLAIILRNLAELEAAAGHAPRARELFENSLTICAASLPPDHPQTGIILQAYAKFLKDTRHKDEARPIDARARSILAKSLRETGAAYTVDAAKLGYCNLQFTDSVNK
jgi:Tfp pilus assembly protein PilF